MDVGREVVLLLDHGGARAITGNPTKGPPTSVSIPEKISRRLGYGRIRISPDGRYLVIFHGRAFRCVDLGRRQALTTYPSPPCRILFLRSRPDSALLVTGDGVTHLRLPDLAPIRSVAFPSSGLRSQLSEAISGPLDRRVYFALGREVFAWKVGTSAFSPVLSADKVVSALAVNEDETRLFYSTMLSVRAVRLRDD